MAELTRAELKALFETGDFPTQAQFADFLDSVVLKSEVGDDGDLDPYPAGDGGAITNLNLPDPLPARDGSALTGISLAQYNDLADVPTYATATTFTIDGNKTSTFVVNRRIRVQQDTGYHYTHVKSSSYDSGPGTTTVEVTDAMTSTTLVAVGPSAFTPAGSGGGMTLPMIGWPVFATTGGSAGAYTATFTKQSIIDGTPFALRIHATNGGASTLNANGGGNKNIVLNGAALAGGELVKDRIYLFTWNATIDAYEVFIVKAPINPPVNGAKSVQVFTTSGTWTKPAGISRVLAQVQAGGGGGAAGSATNGPGSGGAAGGFSEKLIDVSGISSESVTVGSGGAGAVATGGDGSAGSSSSFGSHLSATGGNGGTGGVGGTGVTGGVGSGGDINLGGGSSSGAFREGGSSGGAGPFGGAGGGGYGSNLNGFDAAANTGAGGGGGAKNDAADGGDGAYGIVIVWEYE